MTDTNTPIASALALPHHNRVPVVVQRAVPFYRAVMLELERQRLALGLTMDELSDRIGCADRYWSKVLYADRPSGRQAQWSTVQEMVDALFPDGCDVILKPKVGARLGPEDLRRKVLFASAETNHRTRRKIMSELGKLGGAARSKRLSHERKRKIALKASRAAAKKRAERAAAQALSQSDAMTLARQGPCVADGDKTRAES